MIVVLAGHPWGSQLVQTVDCETTCLWHICCHVTSRVAGTAIRSPKCSKHSASLRLPCMDGLHPGSASGRQRMAPRAARRTPGHVSLGRAAVGHGRGQSLCGVVAGTVIASTISKRAVTPAAACVATVSAKTLLGGALGLVSSDGSLRLGTPSRVNGSAGL